MRVASFMASSFSVGRGRRGVWGGGVDHRLRVKRSSATADSERAPLDIFGLAANRPSILSFFSSVSDNKYRGIIRGRCTSCVASRGAVGVYCHRCPLTAGVSRVARAPALIPLCARLRTAVPETEGLNFANERCCGPGGG